MMKVSPILHPTLSKISLTIPLKTKSSSRKSIKKPKWYHMKREQEQVIRGERKQILLVSKIRELLAQANEIIVQLFSRWRSSRQAAYSKWNLKNHIKGLRIWARPDRLGTLMQWVKSHSQGLRISLSQRMKLVTGN